MTDSTRTAEGRIDYVTCALSSRTSPGSRVREVAAATVRGESTMRSDVKHMFTKHGLSRQSELVRLVLSLAGAPESGR